MFDHEATQHEAAAHGHDRWRPYPTWNAMPTPAGHDAPSQMATGGPSRPASARRPHPAHRGTASAEHAAAATTPARDQAAPRPHPWPRVRRPPATGTDATATAGHPGPPHGIGSPVISPTTIPLAKTTYRAGDSTSQDIRRRHAADNEHGEETGARKQVIA
jgi:hypothetical protein